MCFRWKLHQQGYRRGLLTFNVVSRWTLSEKLYQRAAIDFPMMMQLSTVNIGTTSFDMQQTYIEMSSSPAHDYDGTSVSPASCVDEKPGQDKPLAFRVNRVVIVDIATRKVAPLPNDLVDDLSSLLCEAAEDCRLSFVRPPAAATDKTFKCRVTVRFDDVDFQGHTNTSSYLGFAMECASQAAARGVLFGDSRRRGVLSTENCDQRFPLRVDRRGRVGCVHVGSRKQPTAAEFCH